MMKRTNTTNTNCYGCEHCTEDIYQRIQCELSARCSGSAEFYDADDAINSELYSKHMAED